MENDKLVEMLKSAIATCFELSFKAQSYHWNVEGIYFKELHDLFGDVYTGLHADIDVLAELIRTTDYYAPTNLKNLLGSTIWTSNTEVPNARNMVIDIRDGVLSLINLLTVVSKLADQQQLIGISNAIDDMIERNEKRRWMLNASSKNI